GVRRAPAKRLRLRERAHDLELFDDRAGPPVRDDDRQRIVVLRADVDEVDVHPVDLRDELRQGLESPFNLPPVVVRSPVAGELLHRREPHALRLILDDLLAGPPHGPDTPAKVVEILLWNIDAERTDRCCVAHVCSPPSCPVWWAASPRDRADAGRT